MPIALTVTDWNHFSPILASIWLKIAHGSKCPLPLYFTRSRETFLISRKNALNRLLVSCPLALRNKSYVLKYKSQIPRHNISMLNIDFLTSKLFSELTRSFRLTNSNRNKNREKKYFMWNLICKFFEIWKPPDVEIQNFEEEDLNRGSVDHVLIVGYSYYGKGIYSTCS